MIASIIQALRCGATVRHTHRSLESEGTFQFNEYDWFPRIWETSEAAFQANSSNNSTLFTSLYEVFEPTRLYFV